MLTQAEQGFLRALTRTVAAELHLLSIKQPHVFFVVQAMQYGAVVQPQQLFGRQGLGQGGQVLPAGGTLFALRYLRCRQLLQQEAAGTAAVRMQGKAAFELFGAGEVGIQAGGQAIAIQGDQPLLALAAFRVNGHGQHAVVHQLLQRGTAVHTACIITRQSAHFAVA